MNQKMKLLAIAVITGLVGLVALPVVNAQQPTLYSVDSVSSGNVYAADQDVVITQDVSGDVVVAGGVVTIKGNVSGNVIAFAGAVEIDGVVSGDVFVASGVAVINGNVGGDLRVFAGNGYVNSRIVGSDLVIYAGEGGVASGIVIGGITRIGEDLQRNATTNLTDISYYRNQWLKEINTQPTQNTNVKNRATTNYGWAFVMWLFGIVSSLIVAYVVLRLFPVFSEKTFEKMRKDPVSSILFGVLALVLSMVAGVILLVSLIGIQTLFVLALLFILALVLAGFYSKYMVGRIILEKLNLGNRGRFQTLLFGIIVSSVVFLILDIIPGVGGFISAILSFGLSMWAFGAIITNKMDSLQGKKA